MVKVLLALIFIVRFIALLVGAWQVMGMLSALSWLTAPAQVTAGMWFMLGIKGAVLLVCLALLFGLARVAAKLRSQGSVAVASTEQAR